MNGVWALCLVVAGLRAAAAAEVGGEPAKQYPLEECIRIGLRTSGAAALARYDQALAGAGVAQAMAGVMPQVSMRSSYTRLDEVDEMQLGPFTFALGSEDTYSAGVQVLQPLYPGGASRGAIRAARHGASAADWDRADAERRIVRDVCLGFYDVLVAEAALKLRQESLVQIGLLMRETRLRQHQGTVSEFDAMRVEVGFSNESRALLQAKNACDTARAGFARLLNLDGDTLALDGRLELAPLDLDPAALQRWARKSRPSLRAMTARLAAARDDLAATRASRLPSLAATVNYDWGPEITPIGMGSDYEWHWKAGISANWNFWDGGMTSALVRQKMLALEKTRVQMQEMIKATDLEVQLAYLDMCNARESLEGREDDAGLARKALDIAEARFNVGAATFLDFADANLALNAALLAQSQAQRNHMAAVARLRYACGLGYEPFPSEVTKP